MSQLPLPFKIKDGHTFDSYVVGANGDLIDCLLEWRGEPTGFWLWGVAEAGKTHLAQAACYWHLERGAKAAYAPLASIQQDPELLSGLSKHHLVVLDDVQRWLGHFGLECALMDLYEDISADGYRLLAVADRPPAQCDFALKDLGSRLQAASVHEVVELDDQGKGAVIANRAKSRGLEMTPEVIDFWLARSERGLSRLIEDLERLDQAAWTEQRRLTIPLLKQVLGF